jgi:hypothetical protein
MVKFDETIENLHRTLHAMKVRDGDVHLLLDWLGDTRREEQNRMWLYVVLSGVAGVTIGSIIKDVIVTIVRICS